MKKFTAILFALAVAYSAWAATITNTVLNPSGVAKTTVVTFKLQKAGSVPPNLIYTETISATATNGFLSVVLKTGKYTVQVGPGNDTFPIAVPDDANTYNLLDLLTTNLTYSFPMGATNPNAYLFPISVVGDNYAVQPSDFTVVYNGLLAARTVSLPPASIYKGRLLIFRDNSGFGFNLSPPAPNQVIVESRAGGLNYGAYSDVQFANTTVKSTAPGLSSVDLGSRYAFTNIASITLRPTLANTGAVYLLEVTKGSAPSISQDIMVNAAVTGGVFTNASSATGTNNIWTAAFQSSGMNAWKTVGYIALNSNTAQPTIVFTTTNTTLQSAANRFVSDAFRFTLQYGVSSKGASILQSDGTNWLTIFASPLFP